MSAADFYQKNFGALNSFIGECLNYWVNDLNNELVIEAMKRALSQQMKWSYAEGILKNWANRKVKSLEDVQALDVEFRARNKNRNGSKPIRKEFLPEWFDQENTYTTEQNKADTPDDLAAKKREIDELLNKIDSDKKNEIEARNQEGNNGPT